VICSNCKKVVLVGEKCGHCGNPLALFRPPPADFDKKGELYKFTLELRAGQITRAAFSEYLEMELAKLSTARSKLREGDEPLLEEAFECWQLALSQAGLWLTSQSDFELQSALNWATQADLKINQSIVEEFERSLEQLKSFQADLRLQGPSDFAPAPGWGETDYRPGPH
jgi:rRNA maturation protein Nop10